MGNPVQIKVLIIDDHDLLRRGLATALKPCQDIRLVGMAANGVEGVALCNQLQPDVILVDLIMPEMDGVTTIKHICQHHPSAKIIVLTNYDDTQLVHAAIRAGATSYLLKNISAEDLVEAIRNSYDGGSELSDEAVQALVRNVKTGSDYDLTEREHVYGLTEREHEILGLMAKGYKNTRIAESLFISDSTVKKHVRNVLNKLKVQSRTEAVIFAFQHSLVEQT